ncbi:MAG: hypothetical protein O7J95_19340, partial [Planctomycetota bacterium]|nr:hypothetical protein [Planctomycetota bacterium]
MSRIFSIDPDTDLSTLGLGGKISGKQIKEIEFLRKRVMTSPDWSASATEGRSMDIVIQDDGKVSWHAHNYAGGYAEGKLETPDFKAFEGGYQSPVTGSEGFTGAGGSGPSLSAGVKGEAGLFKGRSESCTIDTDGSAMCSSTKVEIGTASAELGVSLDPKDLKLGGSAMAKAAEVEQCFEARGPIVDFRGASAQLSGEVCGSAGYGIGGKASVGLNEGVEWGVGAGAMVGGKADLDLDILSTPAPAPTPAPQDDGLFSVSPSQGTAGGFSPFPGAAPEEAAAQPGPMNVGSGEDFMHKMEESLQNAQDNEGRTEESVQVSEENVGRTEDSVQVAEENVGRTEDSAQVS